MNFSDNLKKIRKEHHLSQEQLADKLGVSRQSVSKWESSQAYPEMDKLIQISKLFEVNLDDLLNCDIKEKNKEKQSKNSLNKYMDSFFDFVTKTVEMFTHMSLKSKMKCLFEQLILIFILVVIFLLVGLVGSDFISNIFESFGSIGNIIDYLFRFIYFIVVLIISFVLLLHIFKIRYLDYFEMVKIEEHEVSKKEEKNNIVFSDKKEKIVIRDPKGSEYKFIRGLMKCFVVLFKIGLSFVILGLCISLIGLIAAIIFSFLISKTGILLVGILLMLVSCVVINIVFLIILINFLINRKSNKKWLLYIFIASLVLCGIGGGFTLIGCMKFDYISDINSKFYTKEEKIIPMQNDLLISDHEWIDSLEFIEEDRSDIRIIVQHPKAYTLKILVDHQFLYLEDDSDNALEAIKDQIAYINRFKIVDYKIGLKIYTSKENIEKLKQNIDQYDQENGDSLIEEYDQKISDLESQVADLEMKLEESESKLSEMKSYDKE